jgi:hypothetical protein
MIIGRNLIEKMYSENEEIQDEKLYSTGDDELDDLLEKAFSEGYEYAQKEFGNKQNKAARKIYERSMAKGTLSSLGFNPNSEDNIKDMIRVSRLRNRADVTGAAIDHIAGIPDSLGKKLRNKKPSLDQRISAKGALDRAGKVSTGFRRISEMKGHMANRNPEKYEDVFWESITGGKRGGSNQELWNRTR